LSDVAETSGLREFVSAYVLEVEEHLETASTQLMTIEQALRTGVGHLRPVREAFRALHTIKGLSAMVGVEPVVAIAHRMEALLRVSDRRGAKLPFEAVDVLLRGIRAMQSRVRAFAEGALVPAPDSELLSALDALDTEHGGAADELPSLDLEPNLASKLGALELEQLRAGLAAGQRALRLEFKPSLEKSARGVTINQVREQVERLGDVVKIFPNSQPPTPSDPGGLSFVIVLLTQAPDAAVAEAAGVEPAQLRLLAQLPPRALPVEHAETALEAEDSADVGTEDIYVPQRGVVRVDVARLDETVEGLSALLVTRFRLARVVRSMRDKGVDTREIEAIVTDNARQLRSLRAAILRVRMVPVTELLDRLPLIVRGLRRTMNRQVRLELDAGGAEVDKAVAERLFPALVHLLRNAVDHAIETPDERVRRGKPEEGLIRIECSSRSNRWLELQITDDGRGIDPAAVARRAGAAPPQTEAGLLELICRSGLSTREIATTTSGRGMGMEIVKRVTEQLGGDLTLRTELGRGTTFKLVVPLSISVVDAFSFLCAGQRFVTPVGAVEEIIELDPGQVVEGASLPGELPVRLVRRRGRAVPLLSLANVFAITNQAAEGKALVIRRGDESLAFGIDRMLGQQEVVVRPLNDSLLKVPGISGATDLGDGQPTLVVDLLSLSASVTGRQKELRE
jgi:two-component system chemotaxis sensor kinase CheA